MFISVASRCAQAGRAPRRFGSVLGRANWKKRSPAAAGAHAPDARDVRQRAPAPSRVAPRAPRAPLPARERPPAASRASPPPPPRRPRRASRRPPTSPAGAFGAPPRARSLVRAAASSPSSPPGGGGPDASSSADPSSSSSSAGPEQFREFPRDADGNVLDLDGNPVAGPENTWVRDMEREWAATGYDERFFDDDWDEINPANDAKSNPPPSEAERFPFRDIEDWEWRETVTWSEEEAEEEAWRRRAADAASGDRFQPGGVHARRAAPGGPTMPEGNADRPHGAHNTSPTIDASTAEEFASRRFAELMSDGAEQSTADAKKNGGFAPPVEDLTQEEEARVLGFSPEGQASFFDPGGVKSRVVDAHYSKKGSNDSYDSSSSSSADSENHHDPFEPEGPPAVLLAGFRAEETPRVRELVDELGGHDVPVVPVPQAFLTEPLRAALEALEEPDWTQPRAHDRFNQGGEFGSNRCVIFSGLDRGEMATIVSAIEARGLPRLLVVVITGENAERSLGEALAEAVLESREERRRRKVVEGKNLEEEMRRLERVAARENLAPEEMVKREIARQDKLAADERAAFAARDERATRAEAHLAELKARYLEKARARKEAEEKLEKAAREEEEEAAKEAAASDGDERTKKRREKEPATRSGERPEEFREGPVGLGDVRRASGADGETLEAMVMEAVREREKGGAGRSRRRESTKSPPPSDDEESPLRKNAPPAIRWAESTVAKSDDDAGSAGDSPEAREAAMETPLGGNTSLSEGSAIIAEPASAEPNPASSRPAAARDAAVAGPPPPAAAPVVEAQVMTKRMLRELAMRRGVSYRDMLARAEANGLELPDE